MLAMLEAWDLQHLLAKWKGIQSLFNAPVTNATVNAAAQGCKVHLSAIKSETEGAGLVASVWTFPGSVVAALEVLGFVGPGVS